jgi:hypothetical protein
MPNLLRSLILTVLLAFVVPLLMVGGVLGLLLGVSYIPGIAAFGQRGMESILHFLSVFGSGYPLLGMLTMGASHLCNKYKCLKKEVRGLKKATIKIGTTMTKHLWDSWGGV